MVQFSSSLNLLAITLAPTPISRLMQTTGPASSGDLARFPIRRISQALICFSTDLPEGEHTAEIRLIDEPLDKAAILSKRNEKIDDPARFAGLNWYAGAVLLVGDAR